MKKLFSICLVIFFSLIVVNCGSSDLTSEKAKDLINSEIDVIVNRVKEANKDQLDEETLKESVKKVAELKEKIKVEGVRKDGDSFIAKINVANGKTSDVVELKFNKYDSGWKIDELKIPSGNWVSKEEVLGTLEHNRKRVLFREFFRDKIGATMGDMKSIGMAIESYITDNYFAPQVADLREMQQLLIPFHTKVLAQKDAWGNNFHYKHGDTGTDKQDFYWIGSGGSDGKFEGFDQTGTYEYEKGKDIIFHNGNFTYSPNIK